MGMTFRVVFCLIGLFILIDGVRGLIQSCTRDEVGASFLLMGMGVGFICFGVFWGK